MKGLIDKYRKEIEASVSGEYKTARTIRQGILESIFAPPMKLATKGKGPMTHLHPDSHKLHLPAGAHIADWRKYRVEDHPALMKFQARCHAAGLHDPWLRNYAYQWYPNMLFRRSKIAIVTIGLKHGFCFALVLYAGEKIYDHFYPTVYRHTPEYIAKYGTGEVFH